MIQAGRQSQWLVAFEAGDKLSAPFDMVMRVLRALALEVTLDVATPKRPRPQGCDHTTQRDPARS